MVAVKLWGSLRKFADGKAEVEVYARDFKVLLDKLSHD